MRDESDKSGHDGILLGQATSVPVKYDPEILFPISRAQGRAALDGVGALDFHGVDVWHAYELSWLQADGRPVARVGRFDIPASSDNIVESKSLKLYLNSLNGHVFDNERSALDTITRDVGAVVGCEIGLQVFHPEATSLAGQHLSGRCIDDAPLPAIPDAPSDTLLHFGDVEETCVLYSHLLRSLCPVTGQPDWATLWLDYTGPAIDSSSLLAYLLSFREHQEFHEQCVERIYSDISRAAAPHKLTVQALYTRRGGLDISPLRSSEPGATPLGRLDRQ